MDLHEYQSKMLLRKFGIPIPDFAVISSLEELEQAIADLGLHEAVLKVQVHAGGRGKAGGVKLARSLDEIRDFAGKMIGMRIVTPQTGKKGIIANKLLLTPIVNYEKEYYLAATIDRKAAQAVLICSPEGGIEIEEVAAKSPKSILKVPIPFHGRLRAYQLVEIAKFMGWKGITEKQGAQVCKDLAKAFKALDASLLEINPLVKLKDGTLTALDAKLAIDDNALFRHPELIQLEDLSQISPLEALAREHQLAYIAMDGNIGCMVNGAGLAMATMDIIEHFGGEPANFLDVGGGASEDKVAEGFRIILSDPNVEAILVNIFGGIMNCATLAAGLLNAATALKIEVPLIVRMEGTNVEQGKKMLRDSGLAIEIADSLTDAAKQAVRAHKKRRK